jgi:serine/threonine-protein kinase RCK2
VATEILRKMKLIADAKDLDDSYDLFDKSQQHHATEPQVLGEGTYGRVIKAYAKHGGCE